MACNLQDSGDEFCLEIIDSAPEPWETLGDLGRSTNPSSQQVSWNFCRNYWAMRSPWCPVPSATLGNCRKNSTDWTRVISRGLSLPFQGPADLESHIPQGFNITKADRPLLLSLSWESFATWFQVASEKQMYKGVNPIFFRKVYSWCMNIPRERPPLLPLCKQEKIYVIIFLKNLSQFQQRPQSGFAAVLKY